jgi:hypothetical protein
MSSRLNPRITLPSHGPKVGRGARMEKGRKLGQQIRLLYRSSYNKIFGFSTLKGFKRPHNEADENLGNAVLASNGVVQICLVRTLDKCDRGARTDTVTTS